MRERPSLKPTLNPSLKPSLRPSRSSIATVFDGQVSTLSPAESCCFSSRKIVITDEGYTVFARETSSNSVTGEWSACLGEICGGTASLGDIITLYDN
ncbi:hypothetical protein DPMN_149839 [Dreissena polymorpha]|uniref:Uncharacterized protein n=1 Tax=Dreissena polymorpha TaxID=45954 RepID=A0A9D4FGK5_DREPO|nr:hypothetical protein DPMN_149839 [Dreissena polymorpha]